MDHAKKALSRVYWQYRNSPKMLQWIQTLVEIAQDEIETPLAQMIDLPGIDSAHGEQLEIYGRIAGIDRPRISTNLLSSFAYKGTPGAQTYGEAPYKDPGDAVSSILLPDYLYRVLIKAKIMRNVGAATLDEVKEAMDFIFGVDSTVIDGQNMTMSTIWTEGKLPANLLAIVEEFDLIPRPQGVKIRKLAENEYPFAYKGTFSAQPYGVGRYVTP